MSADAHVRARARSPYSVSVVCVSTSLAPTASDTENYCPRFERRVGLGGVGGRAAGRRD